MGQLVPYAGDALSQITAWSNLPADERNRRAAAACRDRDARALWSLCLAHLQLHGKTGTTLSHHSVRAYRIGVDQLLIAWPHVNLTRPTRDDAALYLRSLERAGKSASTIGVRLAAARALYRALRWSGAVEADPFADLHPVTEKMAAWEKRAAYSDSEVESLLRVATTEDRVLVLLGAHAALRVSEAVALHWQEIDAGRRRLLVAHGKGDKAGWVEMSRTLMDALAALRIENAPGDSNPDAPFGAEAELTPILSYRTEEQARARMRALCSAAGVTYRAFHSLRHHAGTKLQQQTGDIHKVARHLRHSSVSTTEGYVHRADDALRESVGNW